MDNLSFIAEIVKALAWPSSSIALALIFRKPLIELLERLQSAEGAGIKVELGERLRQLEEEANEAELPPPPIGRTETQGQPPSTRVFEAWKELESFLNNLYQKQNGSPPRTYSDLREFYYGLVNNGKIPEQSRSIYNNLRILRNRAVHPKPGDSPLSDLEAKEYSTLASRLIEQLKIAIGE